MTQHKPSIHLLLLAVLLATAALHLKTMDNNHRWWGDSALYMLHAKNIATGQPYAATGFIYNPNGNPGFSPPAYPPVYPAILAPLYALFGLDLYPPKLLNLAIFMACLAIFFRYFTSRLSLDTSRVIVIAMIAFSPWFWMMSNLVLSDIPFILFTLIALLIMDYRSVIPQRSSAYWVLSVLLGFVIYSSYGARVLGLLLIPTMIAFDLTSHKTIRTGSLLSIGVFLVFHQMQAHLLAFSLDHSYVRILSDLSSNGADSQPTGKIENLLLLVTSALRNVINNSRIYATIFINHWDNGVSVTARLAMAAVIAVLALSGLIQSCRSRLRPMDIFVILYVGALLVVPVTQGYRYLLPILPAVLLYSCMGAELLERRFIGTAARGLLVPGALLAFALTSYAGNYHFIQGKDTYFGVADRDSEELFEYIRNHTAPDSLIETSRPRIIALFTGRKASIYDLLLPTDAVMDGFQHSGATHLLLYLGKEEWAHRNRNAKLIAEQGERLNVIFENGSFRLYRINYLDRKDQ